MGVGGLYKFFTQRYPLIRRSFSDPCKPSIDNFYLDFNSLVYNVIQYVDNYSYPYAKICDQVCRFVDLLIQIVRPRYTIFIAVDGPTPFAKCREQRIRRFKATKDSSPKKFDTTKISLGTQFMDILDETLSSFLKERAKNDLAYKDVDIIYSSVHAVGEGEKKIFDFIQQTRDHFGPNATHCIFSHDSDVIINGLHLHIPFLYIMRDWKNWMGPIENCGNGKLNEMEASDFDFELIHIPLLHQYLSYDFPHCSDMNQLFDDLLICTFLVGNDFIPNFPDISLHPGQFSTIFEAYTEVIFRKTYLVQNGKINFKALRELILHFISKDHKKQFQIQGQSYTFSNMEQCVDYISLKYPKVTNPEDLIELETKLAFAVLDSFVWTYQYYSNHDCPSWSWTFPYNYAPPLFVVAYYCSFYQEKQFQLDKILHPLEQLVSILPPEKAHELPEPLRPILHKLNEENGEITLDINGQKYEYQAIITLPHIEYSDFRALFSKDINSLLTEEERRRNLILPPLFLRNDSDFRIFDINDLSQITPVPPHLGVPLLDDANIPFKGLRQKIKVQLFNTPSFLPSLCVRFSQHAYKEKPPALASDLVGLLNQPVLINWPFLLPALITAIVDHKNNKIPETATIENDKFNQVIKYHQTQFGIDIANSTFVLLEAHPIISTTMANNRFRFSENSIWVPYQLTTSIQLVPQFVKSFQNPPPSDLFYIKNEKRIGRRIASNGNSVTLHLFPSLEYDFKDLINNDEKEWCDISSFLDKNQGVKFIESQVLELVQSLPVTANINLSFTAIGSHDTVLDGCCRWNNHKYQFTNEFLEQLNQYVHNRLVYRALKYFLSSSSGAKIPRYFLYEYNEKAFLDSFEKLMSNQPFRKFFLVDKSLKSISQKTLSEIENRLKENENQHLDQSIEEISEQPLDNLIPLPTKQTFVLGSRVMFIGLSGPIPLGATGTVVQIDYTKLLVSVILDTEYRFAHSLRRRLTTNRGHIAKFDDFCILD